MPPTPLLPHTTQLVDATGPQRVEEDTAELDAVLKEDGLKRTESRDVLTAGQAVPSGRVTAYQFDDATGAYSAYTYFAAGGTAVPSGLKTEVRTKAGELVFLSGVSVVRASTRLYPESEQGVLKSINVGLPKIGGSKGLAPLLPTMLPPVGLEASSIRYAVGPVAYQAMGGILPAGMLGWDKDAEIATATYGGRGGARGVLTLLLYPTPQIAGDRGRAVEKYLNDAGGTARFGMVKMRRVGPLVGLTTGALGAEQAQELMAALHLNQDLSYDRKMPLEFHTEVKKTASLLQNIAVLCGVMILAAVLLGLFLGGARAGIRVLQGKPAASEPEFLTINLRDQPKALFTDGPPKPDDPR